jgi:diguanylate cyclase (GGDEF)-like protein
LFPEGVREQEVLLWLLALVPAFLLSYYRGWRGVAVAMASGMVALTATNLALLLADRQIGNWPLLFGVVGSYVGIGLALGVVSELLHREREQAKRLALLDSLTGAPNRRYADLLLEKAFGSAQRGLPLTVVLFDLDAFKGYNDRLGHLEGDRALRIFSDILMQTTRRMNLSARYGGEEFLSILVNGNAEGALVFVSRVRKQLHDSAMLPEALTVCTGVAEYTPQMAEPSDLIAAADLALYRAKAAGPDSVNVFDGPVDGGQETPSMRDLTAASGRAGASESR